MLGLEVVQSGRLRPHCQGPGHFHRRPEAANAALLVEARGRSHDVGQAAWGRHGAVVGLRHGLQQPLPQASGLTQEHRHVRRQQRWIVPEALHKRTKANLQHDLRRARSSEQSRDDRQQSIRRGRVLRRALATGQVYQQLRAEQQELCLNLPPSVVHQLNETGQQGQDVLRGVLLGRRGHAHEDRQAGHTDLGLWILKGDQGVVHVVLHQILIQQLGLQLQWDEVGQASDVDR
mmetsp:Transcript_69090/g.175602  ORF Transcript_69090/g.175602 Transcript_69090/m.175602 type:complete len:233 (-) Transcript_69090:811-1509(-)